MNGYSLGPALSTRSRRPSEPVVDVSMAPPPVPPVAQPRKRDRAAAETKSKKEGVDPLTGVPAGCCAVCAERVDVKSGVTCYKCGVTVHTSCYGVPRDNSLGTSSSQAHVPWLCDPCALGDSPPGIPGGSIACLGGDMSDAAAEQLRAAIAADGDGGPKCCLCGHKGGALKATRDPDWAHVSCVLYTESGLELEQGTNGRLVIPATAESAEFPMEGDGCIFCNSNNGFTAECAGEGCKTRFHVTCARLHGLETISSTAFRGAGRIRTKEFLCAEHSRTNPADGLSDTDARPTKAARNRKSATSAHASAAYGGDAGVLSDAPVGNKKKKGGNGGHKKKTTRKATTKTTKKKGAAAAAVTAPLGEFLDIEKILNHKPATVNGEEVIQLVCKWKGYPAKQTGPPQPLANMLPNKEHGTAGCLNLVLDYITAKRRNISKKARTYLSRWLAEHRDDLKEDRRPELDEIVAELCPEMLPKAPESPPTPPVSDSLPPTIEKEDKPAPPAPAPVLPPPAPALLQGPLPSSLQPIADIVAPSQPLVVALSQPQITSATFAATVATVAAPASRPAASRAVNSSAISGSTPPAQQLQPSIAMSGPASSLSLGLVNGVASPAQAVYSRPPAPVATVAAPQVPLRGPAPALAGVQTSSAAAQASSLQMGAQVSQVSHPPTYAATRGSPKSKAKRSQPYQPPTTAPQHPLAAPLHFMADGGLRAPAGRGGKGRGGAVGTRPLAAAVAAASAAKGDSPAGKSTQVGSGGGEFASSASGQPVPAIAPQHFTHFMTFPQPVGLIAASVQPPPRQPAAARQQPPARPVAPAMGFDPRAPFPPHPHLWPTYYMVPPQPFVPQTAQGRPSQAQDGE